MNLKISSNIRSKNQHKHPFCTLGASLSLAVFSTGCFCCSPGSFLMTTGFSTSWFSTMSSSFLTTGFFLHEGKYHVRSRWKVYPRSISLRSFLLVLSLLCGSVLLLLCHGLLDRLLGLAFWASRRSHQFGRRSPQYLRCDECFARKAALGSF